MCTMQRSVPRLLFDGTTVLGGSDKVVQKDEAKIWPRNAMSGILIEGNWWKESMRLFVEAGTERSNDIILKGIERRITLGMTCGTKKTRKKICVGNAWSFLTIYVGILKICTLHRFPEMLLKKCHNCIKVTYRRNTARGIMERLERRVERWRHLGNAVYIKKMQREYRPFSSEVQETVWPSTVYPWVPKIHSTEDYARDLPKEA